MFAISIGCRPSNLIQAVVRKNKKASSSTPSSSPSSLSPSSHASAVAVAVGVVVTIIVVVAVVVAWRLVQASRGVGGIDRCLTVPRYCRERAGRDLDLSASFFHRLHQPRHCQYCHHPNYQQ